jgi:signal transduction histidine kinase
MFDSIRRRLTMGYVGILALILIFFGVIVTLSFYVQVVNQQDRTLLQTAQSEAESMILREDSYKRVRATTDWDVAVAAVGPDGASERILDVDSSGSSLGLPIRDLARTTSREAKTFEQTVAGPDGPIRVVSLPIRETQSGEVIYVVQAAQSRRVVWETVKRLLVVLVPVGVSALMLSAAGGLYMSRRAMRPVNDSFERQRAFIADASHELKTPLTLIRADAEVLARGLKDAEDRSLVDDLVGETDRMSEILSNLLLLARLDAGRVTITREPFSLAAVIAETTERFAARATAEEKDLISECSGKLPTLGDAERTGQILAALLDNALRFTPTGGTVSVFGDAADGRVTATVTDTGPGVPEADLSRVFDRFYRADDASRTRDGVGPDPGGTGLGLSIARDLARAQNGTLEAANAPEGGASFTLKLPSGS